MHTTWDQKRPSLLPAIVCYADILGFRNMTMEAFEAGKADEFLRKVTASLTSAYDKVREFVTDAGAQFQILDMKVFTDNIVVAYPLRDPHKNYGVPELGTLLMLFAQMQAGLAEDGFLLRGAIATGLHYQHDDIAYGEALLEAVDLDKSGDAPRLVIASSVEPLISKHLSWYSGASAPHQDILLEDPRDGRLFIDYLSVAFEHFPDDPIDYELLAAHSKIVTEGLCIYESEPRVRSKYTWLASYHNYACRAFANQFSDLGYEEADPEYVAIAAEAQRALNHLVHTEEQSPRPLDAQRLRQRLGWPALG